MRKFHFMPCRPWLPLWLLFCIGVFAPGMGAAQDRASEAGVRAGFIYNFAKYVEWPAVAEGQPIRICVFGPPLREGQLGLLQNRTIHGRMVELRPSVPEADITQCHVVFFTDTVADPAVASVLRRLAGTPVLTIGDLPDFAQHGGMIGMYKAATHMCFDINLGVAQRAGLKVSSQLLKLAGRVWQ